MLCSLTNFKLPEPDVRLVTLGDTVFKIKLRYRDNRPCRMTQGEDTSFWNQDNIQYDIERVIKYVLHNQENIDPIRTDDLIIYPYKKDWANAKKLEFTKYNEKLKSSPHLFLFYIEKIGTDKKNKVGEEKQSAKLQKIKTSPEERGRKNWDGSTPGRKQKKSESSDESDAYDVDSSDEDTPKKDNNHGYIRTFLEFLITPVKSLGRVWR